MSILKIDEKLKAAVKALEDHGGDVSAAARSIGVPRSTYRDQLEAAERAGLKPKPPSSPNPPKGMVPTGASILYDQDGQERLRWEKHKAEDLQRYAAMEETLRAFMKPLKGQFKKTKSPSNLLSYLKTEYILTDLHLGQYSWGEETGEDYDLDTAMRLALAATNRLIESAPASESCLLNQLGDFFHADGNVPMTPRGNNVLDTDTRHRKVISAGVGLLRHTVIQLLAKHKKVEIRNTPGNHDIHSSMVLDFALKAYFEKEPRVIVHDSPRPFWAYRFGNNLVGLAHGHAPKPNKLPGLLAADYPEWWGATQFKYCRHGHLHHERGFTDMGVKCEGFPTLAAKDAWSTGEGFRSGRKMVAVVLHKNAGEIERHIASV